VYILELAKDGALYVGFTGALCRRLYQHENCEVAGHGAVAFVIKYGGPSRLVGVIVCPSKELALSEEKNVAQLLRRHATVPVGAGDRKEYLADVA
jgi:predicted GIY-YIG superfamily endonuclease